jgi:chromosome segregation ATPase
VAWAEERVQHESEVTGLRTDLSTARANFNKSQIEVSRLNGVVAAKDGYYTTLSTELETTKGYWTTNHNWLQAAKKREKNAISALQAAKNTVPETQQGLEAEVESFIEEAAKLKERNTKLEEECEAKRRYRSLAC